MVAVSPYTKCSFTILIIVINHVAGRDVFSEGPEL